MAGTLGRGSVARVSSIAGNATAPAVSAPPFPQRDVHCPVAAPRIAVLAGPVERVDDPHPVVVVPAGIVGTLLGQQGIVGPRRRQLGGDEGVGGGVALVHQQPTRRPAVDQMVAQLDESVPGLRGESGRQCGVGLVHGGRCCRHPSAMVLSPAVPDPGARCARPRFPGSRRLAGKEEWFWYLAAAVSYITLSIWHKFLLNWFVGPFWLVAVVVVGPAIWDRLRGWGRRR